MGWQIIPLENGLGQWRGAWDELNNRLYGGHPFRDSRFMDALLRYFAKGSEQLCIHRTGAKIDGLLVIYCRRAGVWSQFVPDQAQSAPVLIERADLLKDLFAVLPGPAWSIELMSQDPHFAPPVLLGENAASRMQPHALTMNIELSDSFENYWKNRSKNLAKNVRRYENHIRDHFDASELRILTAPGAMRDAVARYGKLETSGWKNHAGTAVNIENVQGQFYAEVMARFAETGQAEVAEYWLGEKLAASRLLVSGGDLTIILKTSYDESLSKFAPGRLLLKDYLKHAFAEKKVSTVEFYTNATPDQLAWATGQRHISHVMLFRSAYHARMHDAYLSVKQLFSGVHSKAQEPVSGLDIRWYESMSQLPSGCEALFQAGEQDSFDLSADWFKLLEANVFAGMTTRIYVLQRDGQARGVVPLSFQQTGMGLRQASSLTNFYSSLYRPLLSPAVTSNELADYLQKIFQDARIDALRLDAMDPAHPAFDLLESAIRQAGLKPYRFFCYGNWYLPVQGRSFQAYFQGLTSQVHNTVRRREKKFFAGGRGKLEIVAGDGGLEEAIAAWCKIYAASWKNAEPFPDFVPELIRMCAARGWLRLGVAYYDGEPIASQIWIVSHGRAAIYKLAYDEKFVHLSAGTVLTAHLMRHVLDVDKVQEVDYLIGDDAYKKDWMSHRRERWGIAAYNPYTLGGLAGMVVQIFGKARRALLMKAHIRTNQSLSQSIQGGEAEEKAGWSIFPLENNLGTYKNIWDKLNADLYSSHPYFDSNFIEPLLAHFGSGRARICIHRCDTEIDGLVIVVSSRLGKWSLFIPAQTQVVPILVRHPQNLQNLIHSLPGLSLGLDFPCQDPLYSPSFDTIQPLLWGPVHHAHTMGVKLDREFKNYWEERSGKLRSNVSRRFRKVQDAGSTIRLDCLTEPGDMQSAIARFGEMESAGWKGLNGSAVHADNAQGRFYADVMKRFAECGRATVYELYFNDALVAMQLCIASPSMLVLLKTTYDESRASFSPGRLLLHALLEKEFAEKRVREIEFYTNADSEQMAWATHDRWVSHYLLFRNRFVRMAYQLLKQTNHRLRGGES